MKMLLSGLLLSTTVIASNDLAHRPKSFTAPHGKAVFVDFKNVQYDIVYNVSRKEAVAKAQIEFDMPEAGHPVFDSVAKPTKVILNGDSIGALEVKTPENETTLRVLDTAVAEGTHYLTVQVPLTELVEFSENSVKSAFWTSDLSHRQFLERYLPANLEYDQVKMTFNVQFVGAKARQAIYTNGQVVETAANTYTISYPEHFSASSIFFHTVPAEGAVDEIRYNLASISGKTIPVTIYMAKGPWGGTASTLDKFKTEANKVFNELEADYGAWPHEQLLIYNAGRGGMEYCGATITEFRALGHEMFHSYFARGVMPANGNAGWLDEALASWRDNGYQSRSSLSGSSMMSSHPYYTRITDRDAYTFGENFMRLLNGKLTGKGGLKPFMRHMLETRVFAPLFVEEFIQEMNEFFGVTLDADFKRYTFGTNVSMKSKSVFHPMHQKMTLKELQGLL